jgi:uncharacterized damage-inducible protein DinB
MRIDELRLLYEYNSWANHRILKAAEAVTQEQFLKDLGNSFPSVRDTLVHILGAEEVWFTRWQGSSPKALRDPAPLATVAAVRECWGGVEQRLRAFVEGLTQDDLSHMRTYTNLAGKTLTLPLWQQLQHLANHSSYHRGQVTTMLRQLGAKPIATDLIVFYAEKSGQ